MSSVTTIPERKSEFPYLVDVALTNICEHKCAFCYAGSLPKGSHGDSYWITHTLADAMVKANVFDVVFGGGEPTSITSQYRPDESCLHEIVQAYKQKNFKTGVTTRNFDLPSMHGFENMVCHCDAIALSCHDPEDIGKADHVGYCVREVDIKAPESRFNTYKYFSGPRVVAQIILGIRPWSVTKEVIQRASEAEEISSITLLGYKTTGRGGSFDMHEIGDEWIQFAKGLSKPVGIDSFLARTWKNKIIAAGVKEYMLCASEGLNSCFVDAVNQEMRPSSFSEDAYPLDLKHSDAGHVFLEQFSKF